MERYLSRTSCSIRKNGCENVRVFSSGLIISSVRNHSRVLSFIVVVSCVLEKKDLFAFFVIGCEQEGKVA